DEVALDLVAGRRRRLLPGGGRSGGNGRDLDRRRRRAVVDHVLEREAHRHRSADERLRRGSTRSDRELVRAHHRLAAAARLAAATAPGAVVGIALNVGHGSGSYGVVFLVWSRTIFRTSSTI